MDPRPTSAADVARLLKRLADRIGGDFLARRGFRPDTVQLRTGDWILTLDTTLGWRAWGVSLRAPFVNKSGFRFSLHSSKLMHQVRKLFGRLRVVQIDHPEIDRLFILQSSRPEDLKVLFADVRIRELLLKQSVKIRLGISDDGGMLAGAYPTGVDLLYLDVDDLIGDLDDLEDLFALLTALLTGVTRRVGGEEDEVAWQIGRLEAPGGMITGRLTLWEGDLPRQNAAAALGELGDPRAIEPLLDAIRDTDPLLQGKAVRALGELGDPRPVPDLIPLLGNRKGQLKRPLCEDAAEALRKLGEMDLVDGFEAAIGGDFSDLTRVAKPHRAGVLQALIRALEGPGRGAITNTVQALVTLNAVEALPELRTRLGEPLTPDVRESFEAAIEALGSRAALPRPSLPGAMPTDTLPRSAGDA